MCVCILVQVYNILFFLPRSPAFFLGVYAHLYNVHGIIDTRVIAFISATRVFPLLSPHFPPELLYAAYIVLQVYARLHNIIRIQVFQVKKSRGPPSTFATVNLRRLSGVEPTDKSPYTHVYIQVQVKGSILYILCGSDNGVFSFLL